MTFSFSLVSDPWIPVSRPGGQGLVSAVTAVTEASSILGLAPDVPTQTPAVLRQVLLPVVIDALRICDAAEWAETFQRGDFSRTQKQLLTDYLERHRDRFDLFHPWQPFAQVGGLRTANDATRSAAVIVPTEPAGNNVPLFAARTEADVVALTPAQAARWLVHLHCWDTAGIKSGAVGDGSAKSGKSMGNYVGPLGMLGVIMPVGRTLFDTLLLNTPLVPDSAWRGDTPPWRTLPATPAWQQREATGLLDLFTWQSRRVRLIPEHHPDGVRVTRVIVAGGDRLTSIPDFEPHTAWYWAKAAPKTATSAAKPARWVPRRHVPGRHVWRGLDTLLALPTDTTGTGDGATVRTSPLLARLSQSQFAAALPPHYPLRIDTCGIQYGTQSAVIEDATSDSMSVPTAALLADDTVRADVLHVANQVEQLGLAINTLHADLRRAAGGEPIPARTGHRAAEELFHRLDPPLRRLLAGLPRAGTPPEREAGLVAWENAAWHAVVDVSGALLAHAGRSTFAGRTTGGRTYRAATASSGFLRRLRAVLARMTAQYDTSSDPANHEQTQEQVSV